MRCGPVALSSALFILAISSPVSARAQSPALLTAWGTVGTGPGQFNLPSGIAVSPSGDVYVADYGNGRVQRFTHTGVYLGEWSVAEGLPNGIAIDAAGTLYVTCDGNGTVQVFTAEGVPRSTWSSALGPAGRLSYPAGTALDARGPAFIADFYGSLVIELTTAGPFIPHWSFDPPA